MIDRPAIEAAYARIANHVRETPVMTLPASMTGEGFDLALKLELFLHTGSFKPRGAFNNLLSRAVGEAGVVAASGGNHGAAVAFAARALGIPANIFVPAISDPVKIDRIRSYGATLHVGGDRYADALARSVELREKTGAIDVHAYDADETIAGQGTVGLEWSRQTPGLDTVLVAVGGGGLISGIAAWFGREVRVIGVEPSGSRALHAALEAGGPVDVPVKSVAADSLGAANVGQRVHDICARNLDRVLLVEDEAIVAAQKRLWSDFRIAAEPGGATAISALWSGAYKPEPGETLGVLVCGGNVDLTKLAAL